jgi:Ca2+-binding RTX toxin-like protein
VPIDPAPAGTNIQPTDDDNDGIREVTWAADNYGVDGNRDRVLDAEQGQVAGLRLINDGAVYSDYGALVAQGDVSLRGVTLIEADSTNQIAIPLSDGGSVSAALPWGLVNTFAGALAFELGGITPGGSTEALVYLPVGYQGNGNAYIRYNYATHRFEEYRDAQGNRLYEFTDTDADGFGDALKLTLVDGDSQWDGDGLANGVVVDPGFLASGEQEILGDRNENRLRGNILANQIRGKGNSDVLIGDLGDDILRGSKGRDRLYGGEGADIVIGGRGADRFIYTSIVESSVERSDQLQFGRGDRIDLRRIDANANRNGNQEFTFVADAKFSGKAGELRLFKSRLLGDVDGDRQADFAIGLSSNQPFSVDTLML